MTLVTPQFNEKWNELLAEEFSKSYFEDLKLFLVSENESYPVYPPSPQIFEAFNRTPVDRVKVVLLGQDPYHGPGQAHGLCFSVADGVPPPPSLKNIFNELKNDLDVNTPLSGNLSKWADRGVLLLNTTLTVRANQAGSHQGKGWETFTDTVIKKLSKHKENLVFILWGNHAQKKKSLIDSIKHHVIEAPHPSPLSAYRGFIGCRVFSKTNDLLQKSGIEPVNWDLAR